jgi:hypothetical protein
MACPGRSAKPPIHVKVSAGEDEITGVKAGGTAVVVGEAVMKG